jgi:hypothetical protein
MSKKNIVIAVLALLLVAGVAYIINQNNTDRPYSVVYMSTGEVYVGELSTFPDFKLKNGYILQVAKDAKDPNKSSFQLQPVRDALWSPEYMNLIKENIIFYGPLTANSRIAETLAAQKK